MADDPQTPGPPVPDPATLTRALDGVRNGDADATRSLMDVVYGELRHVARNLFARERGNHTLQPTALINEAWMKLAGQLDRIEDRKHFFAVASQAMRRVLTDHARGANREKRGGAVHKVTLDEGFGAQSASGLDLVDLDDSLTKLAELNPRHARVVELRVLGGLTIDETAEVLGVSHTTVEADWFTAKAWLRTALGRSA